jgi:sugar lactone lactonase YvrE
MGLPKSEDVFANPVTPLLQRSGGLALSPEGVLYFANHKKLGTIGKYELGKTKEPETFIDLSEWISASGDRDLRVEGLRLDEDNRLLVAEAGTGKLLRISPDARKLEILADSYDGYRFATVKDLAIGPNGDLYASSPYSGTVYRIRPDAGYVGILNEDLVRVEGLAISPDGKRLVAAEPDASRIVVFDIPEELEAVTSWTLVDFSPSGVEPKGVVFDEEGRLFVALGNREEIRVFDLAKGEELVVYNAGGVAESITYRDGSLFISGGDRIRRMRFRDK